MYTRCPSCRAEISFEPPANMESLPDGYKHRIKCPSCGVTIGVKINKIDTAPATLVQQAPAYTQPQTNFEPVYTNANEEAVPQKKAIAKHSGIGRNITMMLMSLLFIALSVVGYLVNSNTITIEGGLFGIGYLDGITCWNTLIQNFAEFKAYFDEPVVGILTILPMLVFTLAGINFIVALISACGKKYGRAYNLIMSIVLAAGAIVALFRPFLALQEAWNNNVLAYFRDVIDSGFYMLIVSAGLGVLQLLFGLCFCKSLKRKEKKVR